MCSFLIEIFGLRLLFAGAGSFGSAYDYVVAVFAEGFFVAAMFGEEHVAEAGDVEKDGACGFGGLTGGDAEQGGGLFVEGLGFGGEAVGFVAFDLGLRSFVHHVRNCGAIKFRGCTERGVFRDDVLCEFDEVIWAASGDFDTNGFACHRKV